MTVLWLAKSPWEKLRRATSIPAIIILAMVSGESEAGPIVQTILVLCDGSVI
jgi:hypothetical protein